MARYTCLFSIAAVALVLCSQAAFAGMIEGERAAMREGGVPKVTIPANQLRQVGTHDAGRLHLPFGCGGIGYVGNTVWPDYDPETGLYPDAVTYPAGSDHWYIFDGALWIGGIVGEDTLVSMAFYESSFAYGKEMWPDNPEIGGIRRTGDFADDEFLAIFSDTVIDTHYVGKKFPYDDTTHIPLGLQIVQKSYSWRDTIYDNFVILDYRVENIGWKDIRDGWIGFVVDADIRCDSTDVAWVGILEDVSGVLDTFLYDDNPAGRVMIPYSYDLDGDPWSLTEWGSLAGRGVISLALLATSIADPVENFNWWLPRWRGDFGPRRVGTLEDPFRSFAGGSSGETFRQEDKYYLMSHPEVDYNEIEMDIHDSTDGWVPPPRPFGGVPHDTRWLYSFGPFDLPPGDTVSFAMVVAVSDDFHVSPDDCSRYFDASNPSEFQRRLNFDRLMTTHRRADSVYQSGFILPHPGPPVGVRIVDYDDGYVMLAWEPSRRPGVAGYYPFVMDTAYDFIWRHALPQYVTDTMCTLPVINPGHTHFFAVSLIDSAGRESDVSLPVEIIPARPHPPCSLTAALESLTPVLSWLPQSDTSLLVYYIYRAVWHGAFELYDSVSGLNYRDYRAESGVQYSYRVTARNLLQLESSPIGPVTLLPMALDAGVLFCDFNPDNSPHVDPYRRAYVARLVYAVQAPIGMMYLDAETEILTFKAMSHYTVVIFDAEMRGGRFPPELIDSIGIYLTHGGRGIFIIPNASTAAVSVGRPHVCRYVEGSMFHDVLHLDSAIANSIVLTGGALYGDLVGCMPSVPEYPPLTADSAKLAAAPIPVEGALPLSGCLFPQDSVEVVYRYESLYPDSAFHLQVNGIAHRDSASRFVFFNFPLSLMQAPANELALSQALIFLGFDVTCGDINDNRRCDVGDAVAIISYLFRGGAEPSDPRRADVNCDGRIDLGDALAIINIIFRGASGLHCCPP